jgi:hypothetical protein
VQYFRKEVNFVKIAAARQQPRGRVSMGGSRGRAGVWARHARSWASSSRARDRGRAAAARGEER